MNQQCYTSVHYGYIGLVAVPMLACWVFGIPLTTLLLARHKVQQAMRTSATTTPVASPSALSSMLSSSGLSDVPPTPHANGRSSLDQTATAVAVRHAHRSEL